MTVNVGLIGARKSPSGYGIGKYVARETLNNSIGNLIAIMDSTDEMVRQAVEEINNSDDICRKFRGQRYSINKKSDFFELRDLDLVIICSPAVTHEEYISKALANGKHVIVEKPMLQCGYLTSVQKVARARDLVRLADNKNLMLSTNCQRVAAIPTLTSEFGCSSAPKSIDIIFKTKVSNDKLENYIKLYDLLIPHPLSILVKYGAVERERLCINKILFYETDALREVKIEGEYRFSDRNMTFTIALEQSLECANSSLQINIDNNGYINIEAVQMDSGEMGTRYSRKCGNDERIKYSGDLLKIFLSETMTALEHPRITSGMVISNLETYLIFAMQEDMKDLISDKYKNE